LVIKGVRVLESGPHIPTNFSGRNPPSPPRPLPLKGLNEVKSAAAYWNLITEATEETKLDF